MTNNTVRAVICVSVLAAGIGCGDDSAGTACEELCNAADSCPSVFAETDCVEQCESVRAQAATLGGGCAPAVDEQIACQTGLSCEDFLARALGNAPVDECTRTDAAVLSCASDDPNLALDSSVDEPTLACDAFCSAGEGCPNILVVPDCRADCIADVARSAAISSACGDAVINTFDCYSSMSCSDLLNRANQVGAYDSCRDTDNDTVAICTAP